jgi:protein ImuB
MERMLCVWYPEWALQSADAPRDEPHQAVGEDNRVAAVNAPAAVAGIQIGMRRREAEAICPTVTSVMRDIGAEAVFFEPVVRTVEALVPRVEVAEPGLLFVPIGGAVGYYGGEAPLSERVVKELDALTGAGYRIGVAVGPFAARQAAALAGTDEPVLIVDDDAAFLASLDVAALKAEDLVATFRWLGITTLGELARLPRDAIVSRFGNEGLRAHRLAAGEDRDARPRSIPPDSAVVERFTPPLINVEQAAFVARALANRLIESLASQGIAPYRVRIEAEAADGTVRARTWRGLDPFNDQELAERVRWQLRAWLEGVDAGVRGGLAALRIEPADLSGDGRQLALHEDAVGAAQVRRALSEVQALVGPDGVLQAYPQGGRDPVERVAWHRWGEEPARPARDPTAPWPGKLPEPTPALVPPQPRPFEIDWNEGFPERARLRSSWVPVLSWAGPWRKLGSWWEGEGPVDRYQIVTSAGAFLCEVRDGTTWLVGIYD